MKKRIVILSLLFCSMLVGVLAFTPHYTCGCGQVEDGTQLTLIINRISVEFTGKRVFPKSEGSIKF